MTHTLQSMNDGAIEFRRELARNGGNVIAIFPADPASRNPHMRDALTIGDGYVEVPPAYVRRLRHVRKDDTQGQEQAASLLERIDERSRYVQWLMGRSA